jgi:hypothetical protein
MAARALGNRAIFIVSRILDPEKSSYCFVSEELCIRQGYSQAVVWRLPYLPLVTPSSWAIAISFRAPESFLQY